MFFEISLQSVNLFSIMLGMSLVVLSSLWGGRIRYTRIVFVYLAGLAFYYGFLKPITLQQSPISTASVAQTPASQTYPEARVPSALEITGKGRKQQ